jgi:hypothetical protein
VCEEEKGSRESIRDLMENIGMFDDYERGVWETCSLDGLKDDDWEE